MTHAVAIKLRPLKQNYFLGHCSILEKQYIDLILMLILNNIIIIIIKNNNNTAVILGTLITKANVPLGATKITGTKNSGGIIPVWWTHQQMWGLLQCSAWLTLVLVGRCYETCCLTEMLRGHRHGFQQQQNPSLDF